MRGRANIRGLIPIEREIMFLHLHHERFTKRAYGRAMELHFIADDLEEHAWYVDLVADLVEDVERFAASFGEEIVEPD
jgi:hypothetical protein